MRREVAGALASALLLLAVPTVLVGPYLRDDLLLDRIVKVVVLDWRDFGESAARQRLQYELDRQGVGMQVQDHHCRLEALPQGELRVRCAWQARLGVPGVSQRWPLSFSSEARVLPDGQVRP